MVQHVVYTRHMALRKKYIYIPTDRKKEGRLTMPRLFVCQLPASCIAQSDPLLTTRANLRDPSLFNSLSPMKSFCSMRDAGGSSRERKKVYIYMYITGRMETAPCWHQSWHSAALTLSTAGGKSFNSITHSRDREKQKNTHTRVVGKSLLLLLVSFAYVDPSLLYSTFSSFCHLKEHCATSASCENVRRRHFFASSAS